MSAAAGGSPVPLLKNSPATDFAGSWSPDGNWFVYLHVQEGQFFLNKVKTTGQAEPVVLKADVKRRSIWVPVWSPSGDGILYDDAGVNWISADGKTTRLVSPRSVPSAFSADGKTIYGIRPAGDHIELFSMSTNGGREQTIGFLGPEYFPASKLNPGLRLSLTPDGKSVTYSMAKGFSNLWLAEGLDALAPLP
jgi:Tol biopolymer transport system component